MNFQYSTRTNKRAKRILITVYPDSRIIVTTPRKVSSETVDTFIKSKSAWILKTLDHYKKNPPVSPVGRIRHTPTQITQYKIDAKELAESQLTYWNTFYNFSYKRVSIRDQKTRWGSCSRTGTLSFNYRMTLIPIELVEYLVVHELCHTKEMNHSPKFWKLVEKTIPDYKDRRRALRNLYSYV